MEENNISEEQFDIVWLIKYLFAKRMLILIVVGITTLVSFFVYLCKPSVYTAKASILPVAENHNMLSGNMGALASMAGFNLGGQNNSGSIITSDLYPKVAESIPFLCAMVDVKVPWNEIDTLMSYYEYALIDTVPTITETIRKYTIGLPNTILMSMKSFPPISESNDGKGDVFFKIEPQKMSAINKMRGMIKVDNDPSFGTIDVIVDAPSPEQAFILTKNALDLIQNTAIEHKTRRAKDILRFAEERYEDAMKEYEDIYDKYSAYRDTHRNMVTERIGSEYQKLSDKFDLSRSILNTISSQVEQARLEVMQNTPVFTIIDPVVLPSGKSGPKMSFYLFIGVTLGFVGAVGWLMIQLSYWNVFDESKIHFISNKYK